MKPKLSFTFLLAVGWLLLQSEGVMEASEDGRGQCPCACDVNGNGQCEGLDVSTVNMCIGGDCSMCVGGEASGCDANCDGLVDDTDRAIVLCQVRGQTPDGSCDISTCDLGVCCCSTFGPCLENVSEQVCTTDLHGVPLAPGYFCVESACPIDAGPCECDVNDSGQCTAADALVVLDCVGGNCSGCVISCDLDCDGDVDLCDASIVMCQVNAGPQGDPTCCDTVMCGACCLDSEQPGCFESRQTECTDQGGIYRGDDTSCQGDGNGDGIDDACECPCDCDVQGVGSCDPLGITEIIACIKGYCGPNCEDCCAPALVPGQLNACDINCSGVVDLCDVDILICRLEGMGPEACDTEPDEDHDGCRDECDRCPDDPDNVCTGACCNLDIDGAPPCLHGLNQETCESFQGFYVGDGTVCDGDLCPICVCDCDVDGSGECNQVDIIQVSNCIDGDCSGCAPPGATGQLNGCDADCDGDVDQCDLDIVSCQAHAGPEGDPACCDTVLCEPCPPSPACPEGAVTWICPPNGAIDARGPHPREDATMLQGIGCVDELIIVQAPDGAEDPCCWRLDDSDCHNTDRHPPYASALEQNNIVRVESNGDGTYSIGLRRPITPGEVTVITYLGDRHNPGRFESLPGDVNGDRIVNSDDTDAAADCNDQCPGQQCDPPCPPPGYCDCYRCNCDHSLEIGGGDILCVIDLIAGAGDFEPWLDATLPPPSGTPEPERLPLAGQPINVKNRYLSFKAGDAGRNQAILVTFVDLPGEYQVWNGVQMWVSEPLQYTENSGKLWPWEAPNYATFWGATLDCDPSFTNWSTYGVVHVYHEGIVPRGVYDIQVVDDSCLPPPEANYSPPLEMITSKWGDMVRDCITCPCSPPDGSVDIVTDCTAILDKFRNLECAIQKPRGDLLPCIPDHVIDIVRDVTASLDAFRGFPYPCVPSGPPPCTAALSGQ